MNNEAVMESEIFSIIVVGRCNDNHLAESNKEHF